MDVVIEQKIGRSKTQGKKGGGGQRSHVTGFLFGKWSEVLRKLLHSGLESKEEARWQIASSLWPGRGGTRQKAKKSKKNKKKTKKQGYEKKTRFSTRSKKEKGKGNSLLLDLKPENETNRNIKPCSFCKNNLVFPTFQN